MLEFHQNDHLHEYSIDLQHCKKVIVHFLVLGSYFWLYFPGQLSWFFVVYYFDTTLNLEMCNDFLSSSHMVRSDLVKIFLIFHYKDFHRCSCSFCSIYFHHAHYYRAVKLLIACSYSADL